MIRKYANTDRAAVLLLLQLNTPKYFHPDEKQDLEEYLDHKRERYFVYEDSNTILGAGGINFFPKTSLARISWDMVHPAHQGKGIGKALTQYRIEEIKNTPGIRTIQVRTSQLAYKFYQNSGFILERIEPDFWAEGLDLYQMKIDL